MNTLLKITAILCALLLTLTLLCACAGGSGTTDPENGSSAPAASCESGAADDKSSENADQNDPAPVPPSNQGKLSMGEQGSVPAFEW